MGLRGGDLTPPHALLLSPPTVQNGGNLLCVVDDSNDHVLSVWEWAKENKVVDTKVG